MGASDRPRAPQLQSSGPPAAGAEGVEELTELLPGQSDLLPSYSMRPSALNPMLPPGAGFCASSMGGSVMGGSALYMRYSRSMLRRMIVGFSVWGVVMVNYRRTKRLTAPERMSEVESDAVWEEVHKIHSIFCCEFNEWRFRFTNFCVHLSSR